MSINQISTANTFGQLITSVSALIAVSNNLTDGPQVVTNAAWTFSNPEVGVNVGNTALITTANVGTLNLSTGNVSNITVGNANASMANITVANIGGATIGNIFSTRTTTTNANVNFIQVDDRANIFSLNAQTANIGSLSLTTLNVSSLTVPVLNTSFANITDASVTGTLQAISLTATLATVTNANVSLLNSSAANITGATVGTLNVSIANVTSLNVGSLNLSLSNTTTVNVGSELNTPFANAVLANIITLNTSTANISNLTVVQINASIANLTTGTMAANPTTNLAIATKNYVDTGAGANLVNKITYVAKGDLVPGTGANTFGVLSTGSNGQSLVVDTDQTTGLRWANRSNGSFRGYVMRTSSDRQSNGNVIVISNLEEVVFDDGEVAGGWTLPATIDIRTSGVNGIDGGTANANTVYEVYAIRQRSSGTKNFILHRALNRQPDQNTFGRFSASPAFGDWPVSSSLGANNTANLYIKIAQSFTPNVTGPLASIDIKIARTSTPTGNIWVTIEANSAGQPSGTTLATSRRMDAARVPSGTMPTAGANARFIFDNTTSLTAGTSYFWIFNSDYTGSATAFMNVAYSANSITSTGVANVGLNTGLPFGNTGASWVNIQGTTQPGAAVGLGHFIFRTQMEANNISVTMPTGYDEKCLLGYVFTDNAARLKESTQINRTILNPVYSPWGYHHGSGQAAVPEILELIGFVPPVPCWVIGVDSTVSAYGLGRVHALDVAVTFADSVYPGITYAAASSGVTPAPPVFIEHQCILGKFQAVNTKFYPISITF